MSSDVLELKRAFTRQRLPGIPNQVASVLLERFPSLFRSEHDVLQFVPKRWENYGDVVVLKIPASESSERLAALANAFLVVLKPTPTVVLGESRGISGELRVPTRTILASTRSDSSDATTEVVENGIVYRFDPLLVMFSPGNTRERGRWRAGLPGGGAEVVVDMFAGIGYFTLSVLFPIPQRGTKQACSEQRDGASEPLSSPAPGAPGYLVAIEKNANSVAFLKANVEVNGRRSAPSLRTRVAVVCADNRSAQLDSLVGTATRVFMGYLPTPTAFLPRAISLMRSIPDLPLDRPQPVGTLHFHYTASTADVRTELIACFVTVSTQLTFSLESSSSLSDTADDHSVVREVNPAMSTVDVRTSTPADLGGTLPAPSFPSLRAVVSDIRRVKSYGPRVFHWVADVEFGGGAAAACKLAPVEAMGERVAAIVC